MFQVAIFMHAVIGPGDQPRKPKCVGPHRQRTRTHEFAPQSKVLIAPMGRRGWWQQFVFHEPELHADMIAVPQDKQSDLRDALDNHFRKFATSPLREVIASPDIQGRLAKFDAADAAALAEQRSYRRFGRFALWAMMVGTLLGAFALLPIRLDDRPRLVLQVLQGLAMILMVGALVWIGLRKPVGQWMRARAEAERLRADVFRAIARAGVGDRQLLAPALACFIDAHLDWQLGFFRKRGPQHRKAASQVAPFKIVGHVLLLAALLLGFAGLVKAAADLGWSWEPLTSVARRLPFENLGSWQLGLGVMASSVLAFASARSFMDQDDRNAACYALAADELATIKREELSKAEAAAAAGNVADVLAFCEKVQSVLSAEHNAWVYARPPDDVPTAQPPV
jgi:hypothetical protein